MLPNGVASDHLAVVDAIDPDAYAAGEQTTGWIKADDFHQYMAVISVGTLGASATVDAAIDYSTDGSADGGVVTGSAITQLTQAGSDSDKQVVINVRPSDLAAHNADWFRLSVTVGTAASDMGAVVVGLSPRSGPASDFDASTVDEVVTI